MPRFNQKRWNPSRDSSLRHFQTAVKDKRIHLDVAVGGDPDLPESRIYGCPCGCSGWPKNPKASFAMGHDARYRGILIRAHLTGTPIVRHLVQARRDDIEMVAEDAMDLAKLEGDSFVKALEAAELRRNGKEREVVARAMGSKRLIRIGRWEYTGLVAAIYGTPEEAEYEVEYVTKSGEVKRKRVAAADAKEVS